MKQGTIKNASRYLKNSNVLAYDFKQFLASCHVQQVNNLYVFIIMIFIDNDSYRYLEYYTIRIHGKKKRIQSNYRDKNRCQLRDLNPDRQIRSASPYPLGHEAS